MKLHQKKFYSSPEVDRIVEQHAKDRTTEKHKCGYSEALRHIVMSWAGELVTITKIKSSNPEYIAYLNNTDVLDPRN